MALCQTKLGQAKTALNDIDRLAKEFPDESERIALVRAQILLDSNQYSAAYAALTQIINSSTDANVELHYVRSLVAIELNELQSAVTDLKFVISNNPKHIQAINMMTETLIAEGKLDEAKHYNDQASAISPNNPEVLNNTGWIKFRSGDVKASIPYLAKSYQATNNPDYAARLGEALWAQGQQSEAVNVWNRGLEIAPENEMLLNAMRSHLVRPAAR
jgi:tetratricopeptide (TPR) repeat protein